MKCDKLSASRTKVFEQCPFLYFIKYHYKLVFDEERDYFTLGTITHSVFEHILTNRSEVIDYEKRTIKDIDGIIKKVFLESDYSNNYKIKKDEEVLADEIFGKCTAIVNKYISSKKCKLFYPVLISNGEPCIEIEFLEDIGGCVIRGFIDSVFVLDNDTILVNDFKTSKAIPSYASLLEDIQLKIYYYVIKKRFPDKKVLVSFDFVKLCKDRYNTFQNIETIKTEILSKYNKIIGFDAKNVYRKTSWKCSRLCIGYNECYQLWLSLIAAGIINRKK